MRIDLRRCNIYVVSERFAVLDDCERKNTDVVFFEQFRGQVTGAVGGDFDLHNNSLSEYENIEMCGNNRNVD